MLKRSRSPTTWIFLDPSGPFATSTVSRESISISYSTVSARHQIQVKQRFCTSRLCRCLQNLKRARGKDFGIAVMEGLWEITLFENCCSPGVICKPLNLAAILGKFISSLSSNKRAKEACSAHCVRQSMQKKKLGKQVLEQRRCLCEQNTILAQDSSRWCLRRFFKHMAASTPLQREIFRSRSLWLLYWFH